MHLVQHFSKALIQLTTRYAHRILSLFNIDTCNWNALGPVFLVDPVVKELLFLVFQPAICHAIRTRMVNTVSVGDEVFQSRHFGWQPVLWLTCDQMRCPGSKWLLFFPKLKKFMKRHKISWRRGRYLHGIWLHGWKTRNNNSSTKGSELWRNAGPSAFQLQVSMLKSDKIRWAYLVVNCVGLRTFWTPRKCEAAVMQCECTVQIWSKQPRTTGVRSGGLKLQCICKCHIF